MWPFSPASELALSACSRGDAFMAMPQTVPPKEKASETFAFEFQKTQRISLQTLLFQRACPLRLLTAFASTSPKGRGLGKEMKLAGTAKGSHFGGAGERM